MKTRNFPEKKNERRVRAIKRLETKPLKNFQASVLYPTPESLKAARIHEIEKNLLSNARNIRIKQYRGGGENVVRNKSKIS